MLREGVTSSRGSHLHALRRFFIPAPPAAGAHGPKATRLAPGDVADRRRCVQAAPNATASKGLKFDKRVGCCPDSKGRFTST